MGRYSILNAAYPRINHRIEKVLGKRCSLIHCSHPTYAWHSSMCIQTPDQTYYTYVMCDAYVQRVHYIIDAFPLCAGLIEKYLNVYVPAEEAVILFTASL